MSSTKYTARLGPVAVARLATLAVQLQHVAENVEIEPRTSVDPSAKYDAAPGFEPSERLLKAAKLGLARLIVETNPALAGVDVDSAAARLRKLGVSDHVAHGVASQLAARFLTNVDLRPEAIDRGIEALVQGQQFGGERS
jgi:hypothetical protein